MQHAINSFRKIRILILNFMHIITISRTLQLGFQQLLVPCVLAVAVILTGCSDNHKVSTHSADYDTVIDQDAQFIYKDIKVAKAPRQWDWMLPDLNSLAQASSQQYRYPSLTGIAEYKQSFQLDNVIGFVWGWQSRTDKYDIEVFLLYMFIGEDKYLMRTFHNSHHLTVDEAILITFYDYFRYERPFMAQKWQISEPYDNYKMEPLLTLGSELFEQGHEYPVFDGRIVTLKDVYLRQAQTKRVKDNNGLTHYVCKWLVPEGEGSSLKAKKYVLSCQANLSNN
ncbi:hypothetical protein EXU30_01785 [Shewanella maritima]|uniref:Uncharacterized protein n=1 Tax=Shewanella maritima TaxID=2520507 RepID=A0A411PD90_9GAMM|nr:hypothetical protein [Shewanella maritima]QBF81567.1 hypothetical protein EXU30_01785 [Shewanella maritima]